jgi:hypothetical protein
MRIIWPIRRCQPRLFSEVNLSHNRYYNPYVEIRPLSRLLVLWTNQMRVTSATALALMKVARLNRCSGPLGLQDNLADPGTPFHKDRWRRPCGILYRSWIQETGLLRVPVSLT